MCIQMYTVCDETKAIIKKFFKDIFLEYAETNTEPCVPAKQIVWTVYSPFRRVGVSRIQSAYSVVVEIAKCRTYTYDK